VRSRCRRYYSKNRNGPAAGRYTDEPLSDDGPQGKFTVTDLGMMWGRPLWSPWYWRTQSGHAVRKVGATTRVAHSRQRWGDGLGFNHYRGDGSCEIGWRRGRDSPAGAASGLRGAPLQSSFSLAKKGLFVLPKWWERGDGIWPLCQEHDACRNVGFNA